jgi:hypothetical protein
MFRNTYLKTLFEKRWVILWWFIAILITNILILQIFPPMREAFANMKANLPPSLEVWLGADGGIWSSIRGFINLEIMGQMATVMIVFGILFSLSILPAEESSGFLLTQMSRPIRRGSLFIQKGLALVTAVVIVTIGFWLGTWLGTILLGDVVSLVDLSLPSVAVLLITLTMASLTYALAAFIGSKTMAGVIIGIYAMLGYFITSLRGTGEVLTTVSRLTPFYYYNNPSVIDNGFELGNILILLGFIIIPIVIALPRFVTRDLKTR